MWGHMWQPVRRDRAAKRPGSSLSFWHTFGRKIDAPSSADDPTCEDKVDVASATLVAAMFLDVPPAVTAVAAKRGAQSIRLTRLLELGLSSLVPTEDAVDLVLAHMDHSWDASVRKLLKPIRLRRAAEADRLVDRRTAQPHR